MVCSCFPAPRMALLAITLTLIYSYARSQRSKFQDRKLVVVAPGAKNSGPS